MNVSRYFAACADGVFSLQTSLGLGLDDLTSGRQLSFAVVHAESDFKAEVHAGSVIYLMTGIAKIGDKSVVFHHRLFNADGDALVFETLFKCVLLDLVERKARTLPPDMRDQAEKYLVTP
jgi:acyl-CoA thioester hydrolase